MNDDLRFDPVDDELRRRFDAQARPEGDPDAVLDQLRPRFRRARQRRRAAFAGAAALGVVAVLGASMILGDAGGGDGPVRTPPATKPDGTVPSVVTTLPQPTVTTAGGAGSTDGTEAPPATTPTGNDGATGNGSSGLGEVPPPAPTAAPATPQTPTYSSAGGSITVSFDGSSTVSLASSSPAPGFTTEVHDNGPTRVEVRFSDGQVEWRIRADMVNGALAPEITQH
jgi:hypothetical protein